MIKVSDLFEVNYGHGLSLSNLQQTCNGINFISRGSKNNGIITKVKEINNISPCRGGVITVALGGSVMESFFQEEDFYTAYHIKILRPKQFLNKYQMLFYCMCLRNNKYRYNYGRQANKTLEDLLIPQPDNLPKWVCYIKISKEPTKKAYHDKAVNLNDRDWSSFKIKNLFKIERGAEKICDCKNGNIPLISSSEKNNGMTLLIKDGRLLFSDNKLTIANNGSIGSCFYQSKNFYATTDVTVLSNKHINSYNGMFIITLIEKEKYRFNYGRKWSNNKMGESVIKFPIDNNREPDWQFMENYIKSLPYSSSI